MWGELDEFLTMWSKDTVLSMVQRSHSATQAEFNFTLHGPVQKSQKNRSGNSLHLHYVGPMVWTTKKVSLLFTSAETKYLAMCFAFAICTTSNQCDGKSARGQRTTIICGAINCLQVVHDQAILE